MEFRSKIDFLLVGLLNLVVLIPFIMGIRENPVIDWYTFGIISAVLVFINWLSFGTKYIIANDLLIVKAGPLTWKIKVATINRIVMKPKFPYWSSPAMSLDRIELDYAGKFLLLSPLEKEAFINKLVELNPRIEIL
ncbi:MAG: PH domain-containing protein [Saprospiraceae bacterium]|nr:PH domain-containing protein [Saprospiraceae bacterium]